MLIFRGLLGRGLKIISCNRMGGGFGGGKPYFKAGLLEKGSSIREDWMALVQGLAGFQPG